MSLYFVFLFDFVVWELACYQHGSRVTKTLPLPNPNEPNEPNLTKRNKANLTWT